MIIDPQGNFAILNQTIVDGISITTLCYVLHDPETEIIDATGNQYSVAHYSDIRSALDGHDEWVEKIRDKSTVTVFDVEQEIEYALIRPGGNPVPPNK